MGICESRRPEVPCVLCAMPKGHRGDHIAHGYMWSDPLAARSPAPTPKFRCDCEGCQKIYAGEEMQRQTAAAPILEEREAEAAFDRELAELEANAPPVEAQLPDDYDLNLVVEPAGYYIEPLASTPGAPPDQHPEVDAHSLKAPTDRQEQR